MSQFCTKFKRLPYISLKLNSILEEIKMLLKVLIDISDIIPIQET